MRSGKAKKGFSFAAKSEKKLQPTESIGSIRHYKSIAIIERGKGEHD